MSTAEVAYQTVYLWECPDCKATWQLRHRPRGHSQLICAAYAEQRQVQVGPHLVQACGSVSTSTGRRAGVAPNVSI